MGGRAAGCGPAGADGEEHDGLARRGRLGDGAGEVAAVTEVLGVEGDEPGALMRGVRADQLREGQVRLVPERGEPREAQPQRLQQGRQLQGEVAALGDEADVAGPADLFNPVNDRRISELIVDQVRLLIRQQQLNLGDRLPAERELCERFGVSRVTVREALRVLEACRHLGADRVRRRSLPAGDR